MNEISIAVVLSIYKHDKADYLESAVDSILSQTYCNLRLFIGVDGDVSEELSETISQYSGNERILIFRYKENRGLACVLNDLINECFKCNFTYIARMDADDISLPDRLEKELSFLKANPEIDIVGGSISEIDENGSSRNKIIKYPLTHKECRDFYSRRNPFAHPAVMFRKSFFEKVGHLYRPEYRQNQDTLLWYDGLMSGVKMANIQDVVLYFRMSDSLFKKRRNGFVFAKKQFKDRLVINRDLHYSLSANFFALAMFILMISPTSIRKFAYRFFR